MQTSSQKHQVPQAAGEQQTPPDEARSDVSLPQDPPARFVERRKTRRGGDQGRERRQFGSSYHDLSPDAREIALAIDGYKAKHRRRYVTFEEMLSVIHELGYQRPSPE